MNKITIERRNATTVYGIRHIGPYPEINSAFAAIKNWVYHNDASDQVKNLLGIYYNKPHLGSAEQCRSDACVDLKHPHPEPSDQIHKIDIPAGNYACYQHVGSYSGLAAIYRHLYDHWLPQHGYQQSNAPSFEIYHNDPDKTPEQELITEVYIPLV